MYAICQGLDAELDMTISNADLDVLSIFLIKPITSSYCSVISFSTESICSSRMANLLSIRLHKFAKESLAGDCSGMLEGFGGLLTIFSCFVESMSGKDKCKPTL